MCGRTAYLLDGRVGCICHQSPPHPLSGHKRRWAIRLIGKTIVVQEDKFIVDWR
jgi:hypothetical protein